jgi:hypothetical protein
VRPNGSGLSCRCRALALGSAENNRTGASQVLPRQRKQPTRYTLLLLGRRLETVPDPRWVRLLSRCCWCPGWCVATAMRCFSMGSRNSEHCQRSLLAIPQGPARRCVCMPIRPFCSAASNRSQPTAVHPPSIHAGSEFLRPVSALLTQYFTVSEPVVYPADVGTPN